jgi:hypothetical protein
LANNQQEADMKRTDLMTISAVALGTATLTVAAFLASPIEAGDEGDAAKIVTPKYVSNGVEMTLIPAEHRVFKAGDAPVFELTAINTSDEPASVSASVNMSGTSPRDAMSRVAVMPTPLWTQLVEVQLKAKETKTVTFTADMRLPENNLITVRLAEAGQSAPSDAGTEMRQVRRSMSGFVPGVTMLSFSTAVNQATVAAK